MKKLMLGLLVALSITSCTDNSKARQFGGTETIELPPNTILLSATWKQDDLWIVVKDTLTGHSRMFEKSSFGVIEGQVIFNNPKPKK